MNRMIKKDKVNIQVNERIWEWMNAILNEKKIEIG